MPEISTESRIIKTGAQVSVHLDECVLILHLKDETYYRIDSSIGEFVWDLVDEPVSVRSIIHGICTRYRVDADVCEQHLLRLLNDLHLKSLIEITS